MIICFKSLSFNIVMQLISCRMSKYYIACHGYSFDHNLFRYLATFSNVSVEGLHISVF